MNRQTANRITKLIGVLGLLFVLCTPGLMARIPAEAPRGVGQQTSMFILVGMLAVIVALLVWRAGKDREL